MSPQRVLFIALLLEIPPSDSWEGSRMHIARKNVTWQEVEQACLFGQPDVTKWVAASPPGTRLLNSYGRTFGGRPLFCVLKPAEWAADTFYVITAREKEAP